MMVLKLLEVKIEKILVRFALELGSTVYHSLFIISQIFAMVKRNTKFINEKQFPSFKYKLYLEEALSDVYRRCTFERE